PSAAPRPSSLYGRLTDDDDDDAAVDEAATTRRRSGTNAGAMVLTMCLRIDQRVVFLCLAACLLFGE
ncbi:hypothetical protein KUA12_18685, partial [Komagataeibacter oboediens]